MLRGEQVMATRVRQEHEAEFKIGVRLLQFADRMMEGPVNPKGQKGEVPLAMIAAVGALVTMGVKVFRGIHHLGGNCLTEPATMLLRPLSEVYGNLGYILAGGNDREKRAESYLANELIEHYNWVRSCIKVGAGDFLPPDLVANPDEMLAPLKRRLLEEEVRTGGEASSEDRAKTHLQKLINRQSGWASISASEKFAASKVAEVHPLVFKYASNVLHAARPGQFVRLQEGGPIQLNMYVDNTNLELALWVSNLLFAGILDMVNDLLVLSLGASTKNFMDQIAEERRKRKVTFIP